MEHQRSESRHEGQYSLGTDERRPESSTEIRVCHETFRPLGV
jgi:hypothetical protein